MLQSAVRWCNVFLPYARPLVSYCRGPKGVGGMCCHSSTKGHGRLSSLCRHGYTAVNLNYMCLFKAMPLSRAHRPYTWAYATASNAINLQKSAHRKGLHVRQSDRPILKKKDSICGCNFASLSQCLNPDPDLWVCGPRTMCRVHFARLSRSPPRTYSEDFGLWLARRKLKAKMAC